MPARVRHSSMEKSELNQSTNIKQDEDKSPSLESSKSPSLQSEKLRVTLMTEKTDIDREKTERKAKDTEKGKTSTKGNLTEGIMNERAVRPKESGLNFNLIPREPAKFKNDQTKKSILKSKKQRHQDASDDESYLGAVGGCEYPTDDMDSTDEMDPTDYNYPKNDNYRTNYMNPTRDMYPTNSMYPTDDGQPRNINKNHLNIVRRRCDNKNPNFRPKQSRAPNKKGAFRQRTNCTRPNDYSQPIQMKKPGAEFAGSNFYPENPNVRPQTQGVLYNHKNNSFYRPRKRYMHRRDYSEPIHMENSDDSSASGTEASHSSANSEMSTKQRFSESEEISRLEFKLNLAEAEIQKQKTELEKVSAKALIEKENSQKNKVLQYELEGLKSDQRIAEKIKKLLHDKQNQLQMEKDNSEKMNKDLKGQVEKLKTEKGDSDKTNKQLRDELEKLHTEKQDSDKTINSLKDQVEKSNSTVKSQMKEIQLRVEDKQKLCNEISNLRIKVRVTEDLQAKTQQKVLDLEEELRKARESLAAVVEQHKREIDDLKNALQRPKEDQMPIQQTPMKKDQLESILDEKLTNMEEKLKTTEEKKDKKKKRKWFCGLF